MIETGTFVPSRAVANVRVAAYPEVSTGGLGDRPVLTALPVAGLKRKTVYGCSQLVAMTQRPSSPVLAYALPTLPSNGNPTLAIFPSAPSLRSEW